MTVRWNGPDGQWRTDSATLPVDLYRVTQEPTIEQRGLRRVLDIESGRHARQRQIERRRAVLAVLFLIFVVIPAFACYAWLIETVVHHWRGAWKTFYITVAGLYLLHVTRRSAR